MMSDRQRFWCKTLFSVYDFILQCKTLCDTYSRLLTTDPLFNLRAKESPVAETWGKQSGGLYGIGAVQGHLFVLYYQQVERHSGETIPIARTPNRERRLKTRTPERYPVPDQKSRYPLSPTAKQRSNKQPSSS